jgi:hypothetical protein
MDIVDSLICNIDGKEFSITPTPYPGLMYQDILSKSRVQASAGITNSRSREFCSFFCINRLADVGTLGTDPAKFCGLRTLQSDKIG